MNINTDIKIETNRLILRYMKTEDQHDIFVNINHNKNVLLYFLSKYCEDESEMQLDKTISFCINNDRYLFAIELKETKEVIGMILQCSTPTELYNSTEIGFAIGEKHWNKGYTTEALSAMIDFMFSLGIHKVYAVHIKENIASKRVMEKCNMIYEGLRKDDVYYHNNYWDTCFYYLINPKDNI